MIRLPIIALLVTFANPSAYGADLEHSWELCKADSTQPQSRINACTELIVSGTGSPTQVARAHTLRAWGYDRLGRYDTAIEDYGRAIALNPEASDAFYGRAGAYHREGHDRLSVDDLNTAIRLAPKNADAWNDRCWDRATLGDLSGAKADCLEALRLEPRSGAALDSLGFVELKSGHYAAAIAAYDKALKINPAIPWALYGRGIAELHTGNRSRGDGDMIAAKKLFPDIASHYPLPEPTLK